MKRWIVRACSTSYIRCWRSYARPGIRLLTWSLLWVFLCFTTTCSIWTLKEIQPQSFHPILLLLCLILLSEWWSKCFVFQKQSNARFSEPNSYSTLEFKRLTIEDPTSPSKLTNLLDESFLECPKCHTPYPTSRHRELLAHIDYCFA